MHFRAWARVRLRDDHSVEGTVFDDSPFGVLVGWGADVGMSEIPHDKIELVPGAPSDKVKVRKK